MLTPKKKNSIIDNEFLLDSAQLATQASTNQEEYPQVWANNDEKQAP